MATPAAILSILVKTSGAQAAAGQLGALDTAGRKAAGGIGKAEDRAKRSTKTFSALGSTVKGAGVLLGAAGLAKGVSMAISEFQEATKVGAQTTAVLKSTGGAAKVSTKQIQDLANSISKKSGIDDEAIQSGENLLLTFTKIRNETGKGNKIFNQATQVATDMSAALGQDMKSSAIQVGKALNDPVKGVTALQRVGVSFTQKQKDQIKTLENTGHHLEAQKLILKELKTEFSGSAAAVATPFDKLKVSLSNLAEAAGAVLMPILNKVATVLTTFFSQMTTGEGVGGALISKFKELGGALAPFGKSIQQIVGYLQQNTGVAKALAIGLGVLAGAIIVVNVAMAANPFVLAAVAIAALVVGVVTAYREFSTFRNVVDAVAGFFKKIWPTVSQAAVTAFNAIVGAVRSALPTIVAIAHTAMETFKKVFSAVWPVIKGYFQGGITVLKGIISGGAQILSGAVKVIKGVLTGDFGEIWDGIKKIFRGGFTVLKGLVTGAAQSIGNAAKTIGQAIIDAIVSAIKGAAGKFVQAVKDAFGGVKGAISGVLGSINPFGDGLGFKPIAPIPSGSLMGASSSLKPFAQVGASYGLHVSSGLRRGAVTVSGNRSYHASGQAIDLANGRGPDAAKLSAFKALKSRFGSSLAELIYTPGGVGIKNGRPFRYTGAVAADHMDHVHVAFTGGSATSGGGAGRSQAFTGDGHGVGGEQEWLHDAWAKVAPLFGRSADNQPLPSLFKHIRFSGQNQFVGVATTPGKGMDSAELLWPKWLWQSSKGQKALDDRTKLQLFIHEMAHRFQDERQTNATWLSEGGAEAFARTMMDRRFGGAVRSGLDPYNKYVTRVVKEKGLAWITGGQFANSAAAGGVSGHGPVGSGIATVARLARAAGFKGQGLINAIAIAGAESGFRANAKNVNSNGSIDRGYWQINSVHGGLSTFNPTGNARAAYKISSGGSNWRPWVTYNTGAYRRYLNQARAAAGSISGTATKGGGGGASNATKGPASAAQKVNPLDQKLASADLAIEQAKRSTGKPGQPFFSTTSTRQIAAMVAKRKLIGKRIQSIRKALKRHLSPQKRLSLTQELTQRLQEHAQLGTDISGLRHPAADTSGATVGGDIGGDVSGDTGTDPNQALIDSNQALADKIQEQIDATHEHDQLVADLKAEIAKQNQFATDVRTVQMGQLAKGLADFISGQIGGYNGVAGRSLTAGAGTVVRY